MSDDLQTAGTSGQSSESSGQSPESSGQSSESSGQSASSSQQVSSDPEPMSGQQVQLKSFSQFPSLFQAILNYNDGKNAYFIPPVCENWTIKTKVKSGKPTSPALTPATTAKIQGTNRQECYLRDYPDTHRLMAGLRQLSITEDFVALRQFKFGEYVGEPCYTAAAAAAGRPLPEDLRARHKKNWKDGDFDILLIHRHYGLIFCEVKAFKDSVKDLNMSQQDVNDNIRKKLREAVSQLDEAEVMLSHLVHDVAPGLRVCKTVALPNLTGRQVQQAIEGDPHLTQNLCRCLGAADPADITGLCLCSDQLPHITDWIVKSIDTKLWHWWQKRVAVTDPLMTFDLYKRLVARLCGPAIEVTVSRVVGPHKISAMKNSSTRTALLPEEMILLNQGLPRVLLTGNNVKRHSMLLQLTATDWLRREKAVYVVSTSRESHEACSTLYIQIQQTTRMQQGSGTGGQLHLLKYNFGEDKDVEKAVNYLSQTANNKPLYVIADNVGSRDGSENFNTFCEMLLKQVPDLHLWAANFVNKVSPSGWILYKLERGRDRTYSLFDTIYKDGGDSEKFSASYSIFQFIGEDHSEKGPHDCETCGQEMGRLLHRCIETDVSGTMNTTSTTTGSTATTPAVLIQWGDVVVVDLSDSMSDNSGFVSGLRCEGVPVSVSEYKADTVLVTSEISYTDYKRIIVFVDEDIFNVPSSCALWVVTVTHSKSPEGCGQSPRKCNQPPGRCGQSTSSSQQGIISRPVEKILMSWVENAFPDLDTKAHFFPPVFMNRVPMTRGLLVGGQVLVPHEAKGKTGSYVPNEAKGKTKESVHPALSPDIITKSQATTVQDSDIRDDAAMQRVIFCLQKLSENNRQVFVALSQLKFGQYLGEPCYAAAAAQLPLAENLPPRHPKRWKDGDFDVLLIHRHYGLVICEVKSVGANVQALNMSQQDTDQNIRKKLGQAVGQLDKAEVMLSHLVHDVAPGLRVCKTMVLPNLTGRQVQQAIEGDPKLSQELCRCLGAADPADIAGLCLCCDQLSDLKTPWDVDDHVLRELAKWWQRRVAASGLDRQMNSELYKRLVARFCGPATTLTVSCVIAPRLRVKTLAQAVSTTGMCFAEITLFPEQVNLLQRGLPRVLLHGPPGTGKTVMLQLMATDWLRNKQFVHIVSTWDKSLPSCIMLYNLLHKTLDEEGAGTPTQLILLKYEFRKESYVEKAVSDLVQAADNNPLNVIVDEVDPSYGQDVFKTFCEKLLKQVPDLRLWAASCLHGLSPNGWEQQYLTLPLRSPPTVVREVEKAEEIRFSKDVRAYSATGIPSHTDGPGIKFIGRGHSRFSPKDCVKCGKELGRFLWSLRDPGKASETSNCTSPACSNTTSSSHDPVQWRDVFVLWGSGVSDNEVAEPGLDDSNNPNLLSGRRLESDDMYYINGLNSIWSGLRSECVPVQEMLKENMDDVATAASDVVWVADYDAVRGLERKVVVCVDIHGLENNPVRLHAMSRCTSQLVIVTHSPYVLPDGSPPFKKLRR